MDWIPDFYYNFSTVYCGETNECFDWFVKNCTHDFRFYLVKDRANNRRWYSCPNPYMQADYRDMITFLKLAKLDSKIDTDNGIKYATFVVYEEENNAFPHGVEAVFAFRRSHYPILEIYPLTGKWTEISPRAQLCVKKTCNYKLPMETEIIQPSSIVYEGEKLTSPIKLGKYLKSLTITLILLCVLILLILIIYLIMLLYEKFKVNNIIV